MSTNFTEFFDDSYLGSDFDLFDRGWGGDLRFNSVTQDIAVVSGLENLKKAIIRRLSTPRGELSAFVHDVSGLYEVNSEYGCVAYNYLSEPISAEVLVSIKTAIQDCLAQEGRIVVDDISYFVQPEASGRIVVYYSINYTLAENPQFSDTILITQLNSSFSFV